GEVGDKPIRARLPAPGRGRAVRAALVHPDGRGRAVRARHPGLAHVLWSEGLAAEGEAVRFDTASGPPDSRAGRDGTIWLDFPATPAAPVDPPAELLDAL